MRELRFKNQVMKNFRCHEDMEFSYDPNRFVTIVGANGSGKTSIFSGLVWACYNETIEGMTGDSIVRKKSGKDTCVQVEWSDGSDEYEVHAYRKHSKYKNKRFLLRNGKDISENTEVDTLKKIENLLMPRDIFLNCLLFSQYVKNHFIDLTHSGQKELLDAMLLLDRFDLYSTGVSIIGKQTEKTESEINEEINKSKIVIEKFLAENEERKREIISEKHVHEEKLERINKENAEYRDKLKELSLLSDNPDDIQLLYQAKKEEIIEIDNKLKSEKINTETKLEKLRSEFVAEKTKAVSELKENNRDKIDNINSEINKYKDEIQALREELHRTKEVIRVKAQEARDKDREKRESELTPIDEQINNITSTLSLLADKVESLNREKKTLEVKKSKSVELLNSDNPTCSQCGQQLRNQEAVAHIKKHIEELNKQISEYDDQIKKLNSDISTSKNKIDQCKKNKIDVLNKYDEVDKNREERIEKKETELVSAQENKIKLVEDEISSREAKKKGIVEELKVAEESVVEKIEEKYKGLAANLRDEYTKSTVKIEEDKANKTIECSKLESRHKAAVDVKNKLTELENRISINENTMATLKESFENHKSVAVAVMKKNTEKVSEIEKSLKVREKDLESLQEKKSILNFWKKGFSDTGIKSILLDESIPILNARAKELCENFPKIKVRFNSQTSLKSGDVRNKFSVDVLQTTNLSELKELSSGERRMTDIIVLLCLRHLLESTQNAKLNIMLLDEILDSLDPDNASIAVNMVKQLSRDHCVVLISHTLRDFIEADETLTM